MGLEPVFAHAGLDHDGNIQGDGGLHFILNQGPHFRLFRRVEVEDQFVMDLEHHAGLEPAPVEFAVKPAPPPVLPPDDVDGAPTSAIPLSRDD